ncbi:F-box protein At5g62510-like [Camellia sinensis]|uniref:F-box protein At5g62510-like n=1 Tax=Camellia sinensis TaxID=4442 RepID=UPI0010355BDF|nr:F-box protein At5g62510-like [Camellia sinensis]
MRNGCAISLALIEGSDFGQTTLLKKEKTKEMVSHYIDEDVMVEILVKLPVKSLLRFKCVSKSWSSLITNHSFIAKHLTNSNKKENGCLFVHRIEPKDANNFPRKYTFAVCRDKSLTVPVFEYLGLKLNAKVHVMGPCNGIFCLLTNWNSVALWNPANRESRALPPTPFLQEWNSREMLLGLGWILSLVIIKWFQLGCTAGVPALIFTHQVTLNTLLYIHCVMILGEISRVFFQNVVFLPLVSSTLTWMEFTTGVHVTKMMMLRKSHFIWATRCFKTYWSRMNRCRSKGYQS